MTTGSDARVMVESKAPTRISRRRKQHSQPPPALSQFPQNATPVVGARGVQSLRKRVGNPGATIERGGGASPVCWSSASASRSRASPQRASVIDRGELPGLSSVEREELRAARRRIAELETELAVHRRAAELLKESVPPKGGSRRSP